MLKGSKQFVASVVLIVVGLVTVQGTGGVILAVVGLATLAAGVFDSCIFAPLFGLAFSREGLRKAVK